MFSIFLVVRRIYFLFLFFVVIFSFLYSFISRSVDVRAPEYSMPNWYEWMVHEIWNERKDLDMDENDDENIEETSDDTWFQLIWVNNYSLKSIVCWENFISPLFMFTSVFHLRVTMCYSGVDWRARTSLFKICNWKRNEKLEKKIKHREGML